MTHVELIIFTSHPTSASGITVSLKFHKRTTLVTHFLSCFWAKRLFRGEHRSLDTAWNLRIREKAGLFDDNPGGVDTACKA